jgi:hypothetical protein
MTIGDVLFVASAIPAVASVLVFARVPWWRTPLGRHLMSYMAVIAAVLGLGCLRLVIGQPPAFEAIRTAVFALVPVVMWWRLIVLVQAQRRDGGELTG